MEKGFVCVMMHLRCCVVAFVRVSAYISVCLCARSRVCVHECTCMLHLYVCVRARVRSPKRAQEGFCSSTSVNVHAFMQRCVLCT
jgi:hypothetical protein